MQEARGMADFQINKSLYLVQHGEATAESVDPRRPLTTIGRATVERVAAWAARVGLKVDQIRHSGKLRAQETATVFAEKLRPREGITVQAGLAPNGDVQPVAEALLSWPDSVMLIGHLPFLGRLTGVLLAGDPQRQLVRFRYGGLVGLICEDKKWMVACVVPPELVGGTIVS